jgi:acyl transferase domain-containing protein/acyl carrier protein
VSRSTPSVAGIRDRIVTEVAQILGVAPESVATGVRFRSLGLESAAVTGMVSTLAVWLGRSLPPTVAWDRPTIDALARHLAGEAEPTGSADPAAPAVGEPIAVVGMACRFPGAPDLEAYWRLLRDGVDAITEVPADRWDVAALFDPDASRPGMMSTKWGGFLAGVAGFDPGFFGISPREAVLMDPQQRLMLELAWSAAEDAGRDPESLRGTRTGVFLGALWSDYARLAGRNLDQIGQHTATGQDLSIIPARVSYTLGLRGPSVGITTACSSSLVAVHLASQSLRLGESSLALAGGVNLVLAPESTVAMTKFGAMSPNGRSRAFDDDADGYVRGEGGGVVVLKRLNDAVRDGDRIYCVIRGSAVNNDGYSNGLTAPNPAAQEDMLRDAYAGAGVNPAEVGYVEAHGTGTALGDPIEAGALGRMLGRPGRPLLIGSVKSNIGHLESAAGIAGLIKTGLAVHHGVIPPSLHFTRPNKHIPFDELGLRVAGEQMPWPDGRPAAGVSSFGFGGTNCHVVLNESPIPEPFEIPIQQGSDCPRLVFVCSGQGGHWPGMARDLLGEPVFRAAVEQCDRALDTVPDMSVVDFLVAGDPAALDRTQVVQPVTFAIQVALAELLRSWGVEPQAVVGHSLGEVAAAYIAGLLSLPDAIRVVRHRAALMSELDGQGAVAVIDMPQEQARAYLAGGGDRVYVAGANNASTTVLSGEPLAVDEVLVKLRAEGVAGRKVAMRVASHSPQCDPLLPRLRTALANLETMPPRIPMISTVTGEPLERADAGYWVRNLREPVVFGRAVDVLRQQGPVTFVELAPHPVLSRAIGGALPVMRRSEPSHEVLADTVERLRQNGHPIAPLERARLLPLSAHSPQALRDLAGATASLVEGGADLAALCHTAAAVRSGHSHRLAVAFRDRAEVAARLRADPADGKAGDVRVAMVFSGQGTQWQGMAVALMAGEPVFRAALYRVDREIRGHTGWSVVDELTGPRLARTEIAQPAIFAVQVALAELWRSWGIEPCAVAGHSVGEIAAAHVAGILDLATAARVACLRGKVMGKAGPGAMASVGLPPEQAADLIAGRGLRIAAINSPTSVVLSGERADLDAILADLGSTHRMLPVEYAFHSHLMAPHRAELAGLLAGIESKPGRIPMVSTMTGDWCGELDGEYWARTVTDTVLFAQAIERLTDVTAFLEVGPHPALGGSIRSTAQGKLVVASLRQGQGRDALLASLGALYSAGADVDWKVVQPPARITRLPEFPWQRERYWIDAAPVLSIKDVLYQLTWSPSVPVRPGNSAREWVVLGDRALAGLLPSCTVVDSPADLTSHREADVVYAPDMFDPEVVRAAAAAGSRLWLVTQRGQAVLDDVPDPAQAAIWGAGRVLALEHPDVFAGLADHDGTEASLRAVACHLQAPDDESQVAFRDGQRFVPRLAAAAVPQGDAPVRADGCYLITGGLGGVGLHLARWLVDRGAQDVVLVARHGPSPQASAALRELNARVHVCQADVADEADMTDLFEWIGRYLPPLRGVLHAAGLLDDGVLLHQDISRFERVLAPKLTGALHLHQLTRLAALDFFVVFSSFAAVLGSAGQANYAAANAAMDAVVHLRRAEGLPACGISWGPWDRVGMTGDARQRWESRGIRPFPPATALRLLDSVIASGVPHRVALDSDTPPVLSTVVQRAAEPVRHVDTAGRVNAVVAEVLGLPAGRRVDPDKGLFDLGVDSLMGVEVANRLRAQLPGHVRLPATLTIDCPTVNAIAALIDESRSGHDQPVDEDLERLLAEVEGMSEDEVARYLR